MRYRSLIGLIVVVILAVSCGRTQLTIEESAAGGSADLIPITKAVVTAFCTSAATSIRLSPIQTATRVAVATQYEIAQIATLNASKELLLAEETQWAWDLATVHAGGELPTMTQGTIEADLAVKLTEFAAIDHRFSPTPEPLTPQGLSNDCPTGYRTGLGNCWNIHNQDSTISYFVIAGADMSNLEQGYLIVLPPRNIDGKINPDEHFIEYPAPPQSGAIAIEAAAWPLVYLKNRTMPPQRFIFNLETRQWLNSDDVVFPTIPAKITPVAVTPTSN